MSVQQPPIAFLKRTIPLSSFRVVMILLLFCSGAQGWVCCTQPPTWAGRLRETLFSASGLYRKSCGESETGRPQAVHSVLEPSTALPSIYNRFPKSITPSDGEVGVLPILCSGILRRHIPVCLKPGACYKSLSSGADCFNSIAIPFSSSLSASKTSSCFVASS